ncbi:MAG: competence protein ComE [Gloeomargaritaceae cyanobacterium C42_A2020_066]|nr:competence protein ComE [Gloeomargaritaceae cyanobacterium C42_A2020_066]
MRFPKFLPTLPIVVLAAALVSCGPRPTQSPLPQDPQVKVFFNQSEAAVYTDPYRKIRRVGDDFEAIIVEEIRKASAIDAAVQEIRLPLVAQALVDQHKAGKKVRVIIENNYNKALSRLDSREADDLSEHEKSRYEEVIKLVDVNGDGRVTEDEVNQRDAIVLLERGGVPLIDDTADGSRGSGLMHHKFMVFDNRKVLITSANLTTSDVHGDFATPESRGNPNSLLLIDDAQVARIFTEEFDIMWGDGPSGRPDSLFGVQKRYREPQTVYLAGGPMTIQFSATSRRQGWDQSVNGLIGRTLEKAQQSVDMLLFVFSDQALVNVMQPLFARGVTIRLLNEPDFAFRDYSETLDMWGLAIPRKGSCKYEDGNAPWSSPNPNVGVPNLPKGDRLHHKMAVIDRKTVIVGSQNWTPSANHMNDETLVVIENPTVAAHFQREADRMFKDELKTFKGKDGSYEVPNRTLGPPDWLIQKAQSAKSTCG